MSSYQPQTSAMKPNPPANFNSLRICSASAVVFAFGTAMSAAAEKLNIMTRLKKTKTNHKLMRMLPIHNTKHKTALSQESAGVTAREVESCNMHADIMERLAGVPSRAGGTTQFCESRIQTVERVLGVGQAAPVNAKNGKNHEGICVAKNELGETSQNHANSSDEVIVARQPDETGRWIGAIELQEDAHGARVRDQKAEKTEEGGVTEAFRSVSVSRRGWLEE